MDPAILGGGSDPYVVITTDPGELLLTTKKLIRVPQNVRTSVVHHDLNPKWKENVELTLASVDLAGLSRNASLIFAVWDYDKMNDDDLIGAMTVPLRFIIDGNLAGGNGYDFAENLQSNSEVMGKLLGTIKINGDLGHISELSRALRENNMESAGEQFTSLKTALQSTSDGSGGCCTVN